MMSWHEHPLTQYVLDDEANDTRAIAASHLLHVPDTDMAELKLITSTILMVTASWPLRTLRWQR